MKAKTPTRRLTLALPACLALATLFSGCGGGGGGGTSASCLDLRYATVGWSIEEIGSRAPLNCQQAGAVEVDLNFGPYSYTFKCTDYENATDANLPVGSYLTSLQLVAQDGTVLSDTNTLNGATYYPIYSCAVDDIPQVIFSVQ